MSRKTCDKLPLKVSFASDEVIDSIADQERYHYEKAILEMFESFKLGALRVQLSGSDTENSIASEDEYGNTGPLKDSRPSSGKGSYIPKDAHEKQNQRHRATEKIVKTQSMDIEVVYKELSSISRGLKKESKQLRDKESKLEEKQQHLKYAEKQLRHYEETLESIIEQEVQRRLEKSEQVLEQKLMQKSEETAKWRNSFQISKQANDSLKKQVQRLLDDCKSFEGKVANLQTRLANSQRKNEILEQQTRDLTAAKLEVSGKEASTKKLRNKDPKVPYDNILNILALLLEWVYDSSLEQYPFQDAGLHSQKEYDIVAETTRERCRKVLPMLCTILPQTGKEKTECQLSFLRFIHCAVLTLPSSQKGTLATTCRRISEDLLRPQPSETSGKRDESGSIGQAKLNQSAQPSAFFHSRDEEIRVISSVIVLQTTTKVEDLVTVFDSLKLDLRNEYGKQIFLQYHGTRILHPFLKLTNKPLLSHALDVLMLLAIESPLLPVFLESISNQEWLATIILLLQSKGLHMKSLEKIVIVLQKLSKLRSNKRLFESLQVETMVHELLRIYKADNAFLAVNLQSTLFNISAMKSGVSLSQNAGT